MGAEVGMEQEEEADEQGTAEGAMVVAGGDGGAGGADVDEYGVGEGGEVGEVGNFDGVDGVDEADEFDGDVGGGIGDGVGEDERIQVGGAVEEEEVVTLQGSREHTAGIPEW